MSKFVCILSSVILTIFISCSHKIYAPSNEDSASITATQRDEEGVVQDPASTCFERLLCDKEIMNKRYPAYQYDNGDDYVKEGMYRIVDERGRIGYADEQGETVITPRFAFGFPFENGKAKVTDSGQKKRVEGSRGEYNYWESDDWYNIDKTGCKLDD